MPTRAELRNVLILPVVFLFAACGGGSGGGGGSPSGDVPDTSAPPTSPPQSNVNIDNPTLVVADNDEVSPGDTLTLVWSDEFNGTSLDPQTWFFETGDGSQYGIPGWGNNELQYYQPNNAQIVDGMLVIEAREQTVGSFNYTSARINTRDRFAFRHGRIEARMRLPGGQGLWPAFWLLPQDSPYGGWAASGEIDVMEAVSLGGSVYEVYIRSFRVLRSPPPASLVRLYPNDLRLG